MILSLSLDTYYTALQTILCGLLNSYTSTLHYICVYTVRPNRPWADGGPHAPPTTYILWYFHLPLGLWT